MIPLDNTLDELKKNIELFITSNSIFYDIFQIEDCGYTHCIKHKHIKSEKWNLNVWKNSFNSISAFIV